MVASASTPLRPLAGLLSTDSNTVNTVNTVKFIAVQWSCEIMKYYSKNKE